jgi:hypothetical protein
MHTVVVACGCRRDGGRSDKRHGCGATQYQTCGRQSITGARQHNWCQNRCQQRVLWTPNRPLLTTEADNFCISWEPAVGLEPTACGLRNRCSATELRRRGIVREGAGGGRARVQRGSVYCGVGAIVKQLRWAKATSSSSREAVLGGSSERRWGGSWGAIRRNRRSTPRSVSPRERRYRPQETRSSSVDHVLPC